MLTPKEKIPSAGKNIPREGWNPRRCIKQDSEPNTLPTSYPGPMTAVTGEEHSVGVIRVLHLEQLPLLFSWCGLVSASHGG